MYHQSTKTTGGSIVSECIGLEMVLNGQDT